MKVAVLTVVFIMTALSGRARADELSAIRTVRSLSAETAEVIQLESRRQVTTTYARAMRAEAQIQLEKEIQQAESPELKQLGKAAMSAIGANDSNKLVRIVTRLLALERTHGRAD